MKSTTTSSTRTDAQRRCLIRLAGVVTAFSVVSLAAAAEMRGTITVTNRPLTGALVRVELPGQTIVTKTNAEGVFHARDIRGPKAAVSVIHQGQMVYRAIHDVTPDPLTISLSLRSDLPADFSPIGVSISDRDEVYTADIRGRVYKYGSDGLTFVGNTDRIADFTVADVAGQTTVAAVVDSSPCRLAILSEANGKLSYILVGASTFPCSAIALGNRRSMLYVGRLNDIYAVSIPNYRPKFLTSFRRTDAGPLVTDDQSRRIFVGDDSRIFAVSYDGGGSRTFARDLGRIRSLAVDASRRRLYAGDINGRRVWQLSLAEDKSPPVEFLNRQSVSTPLGLGIDSKGTVWVGDKDKRALLAFSPDGKLLQTISAK